MDRPRLRVDVILIVTLCLFLVVTLAWASMAEVELAAVAPGRIVPRGQVKTIRAFAHGKVRRILVTEGSVVARGDILVELDKTLVDAEIAKLTSELAIKSVEAARLDALLGWQQGTPLSAPNNAPNEIVAVNESLLADQIVAHRARLQELDDLTTERAARVETLALTLAKHRKLLPILRERTAMRESLYRKGLGAKLDYFDEQERLVELQGNIALREKELVQATASLAALRAQTEGAIALFRQQHHAALAGVRERMIVLREDIRQTREHRDRHTLISPVDGVVQDLTVHTEGGFVEPGVRLMVIVPRHAGIRVEAFVSNADIGFVKPGQQAMLKIATFDFRRYGAIQGTVSYIGKDAVNAGGQPPSATAAGVPPAPFSAPDGTSGPVFKALIDIDQTYMEIDGRKIDLLPGMSAEASVILGRQRVIEYVLQPLRGYRHDALREK